MKHFLLTLFCVAGAVAQQPALRRVRVFVALCDNAHQGIAPVSAILGDGEDPANNLYWGAMYGVKRFLDQDPSWILKQTTATPRANVLERLVFMHRSEQIVLTTDAYRGAAIRQATADFFDAASGRDTSAADLVVYVGHNGLMDFEMRTPQHHAGQRQAMVLACRSEAYFAPRLKVAGCEPLLLTTGFMAPEAYTLVAALDAWMLGARPQGIRAQAASAYHRYQKCGLEAARRLFGYRP
jgi:hypothetical protein